MREAIIFLKSQNLFLLQSHAEKFSHHFSKRQSSNFKQFDQESRGFPLPVGRCSTDFDFIKLSSWHSRNV